MEEPVEITLEIPQWLVREIEFYATPRGLSFSGVVVGLLTSEVFFKEEKHDGDRAIQLVRGRSEPGGYGRKAVADS